MVRVLLLALLAPVLPTLIGAAPVPISRRAFTLLTYDQFQISDGTAGDAQAKANAVFIDPLQGQDLSTLDDQVATDMETMRQAAESAETGQFNPAIDAASGADKTALQNGKIANKVLKLTGEVQVINIKIAKAKAAGDSTTDLESKLAAEQTKLTNNIATDKAAAGQASKGVTGGSSSATSATTAKASTSDTSTSSASATKATATSASTSTSAAASSTSTSISTATQSDATVAFKLLDYSQFQISDGVAGDAQAQANAVFVDMFNGVDLSTLDDQVASDMNTMREAAESAETDQFNPAIAAASGSAADALQVGKIKNKVLKLTGEVQVLNIKIAKAKAAGSSTSDLESQLATEQTKLTTNIKTDVASKGQASKGVA